jgi:hypothetical protein
MAGISTCGAKLTAEEWRRSQSSKPNVHKASAVLPADRPAIVPLLPRTPSHQRLLPFEDSCIHSIREKNHLFRFGLLQRTRTDGHHLWENLFRRFGPLLSSNVVRNGCIVYVMYKNTKHRSGDPSITPSPHPRPNDTAHYLYYFCQAARDAIARCAYDELAYGCFAVCLHALRLRHDFDEIANHATGFRLAVLHLMKTPQAASGEETFFLECLWEKLVWIMAEQSLFKTTPHAKVLKSLMTFAYPLLLSTYNEHPPWIRNSFKTLTLKFQLIRVVAALDSSTTESPELKTVLVTRFLKWCAAHGPQSPLGFSDNYNGSLAGELSTELWICLLELLQPSDKAPRFSGCFPSISRSRSETIYSLQYIISCIPEEDFALTVELYQLNKLAIECLTLAGLVMAEQQVESSYRFILLRTV